MSRKCKLLVFSPEVNMDIYYATKFSAPDEIVFIELDGKKMLFLKQLEYERGRSEAKVDAVYLMDEFEDKSDGKVNELIDILLNILKKFSIVECVVPKDFPVFYAEKIRSAGATITIEEGEFYPQRVIKTNEEKDFIYQTMRTTEGSMQVAENMLRNATIKGNQLYLNGEVLTSEKIKMEIALYLYKNNCYADYSIVSCGDHGVEPHNQGSGPIYANQTIIIDIFPRSLKTKYFGDLTRTFIKGKPSDEQLKLYETVKKAQLDALNTIKAGVDGEQVHLKICNYFDEKGFQTGPIDGKLQGFIHSTGHGLGLAIHEFPRIAKRPMILQKGMVVTVEPGLYYYRTGGVRIEDTIYVTETGIENLTLYHKNFIID